jgi:hypothetical protein
MPGTNFFFRIEWRRREDESMSHREEGGGRKKEGGRRKEERGRRKEEGGRRKERGGRKKGGEEKGNRRNRSSFLADITSQLFFWVSELFYFF